MQGGTSSSKTWSDLQLAIRKCEVSKKPVLISVVAESVPHLKRGAIRDFFNILDTDKTDPRWSQTDSRYTFDEGSVIEFFSVDDASKLRGARRDWLILNECNNINYQAFQQLEIRTKDVVIGDWNPEVRFWWHKEVQGLEDAWFDISTHWDNPYLDDNIRKAIESKKDTDPEWYRVYGEGLIGQYEGIVFQNWEYCDTTEIEPHFDTLYYGLDFGYFPDPAVFVIVAKKQENIYILREMVFNEFSNQELAEAIKPYVGKGVVFCDSAEPKSIRELKDAGIQARGVRKGADSRRFRINWLKSHKLWVNKPCKNLKEELENFSRLKDKNGQILPMFQDGNDHGIDAVCYSLNAVMYQTKVQGVNLPL